ncbi:hypothetical protein ACP70R_015796 [Stipagrostis hirtigluma subsp. patula]
MGEDDGVDEAACPGDDEMAEKLRAEEHFRDLLAQGDASCVAAAEEDDEDVGLAAREDETASRKRARYKIKGTPIMTWRHLAGTQALVHWLPAVAALRCMLPGGS